VVDVLLHLPVTVIDNLAESRARAVGQLGGQQGTPTPSFAPRRGWPLLIADPACYAPYEQIDIDLEPVI
jgi:hypothetical protein